jgi:hypothetical protein
MTMDEEEQIRRYPWPAFFDLSHPAAPGRQVRWGWRQSIASSK